MCMCAFVLAHIHACIHRSCHTCGGRRTACRNQCSPSTMSVRGLSQALRLSNTCLNPPSQRANPKVLINA